MKLKRTQHENNNRILDFKKGEILINASILKHRSFFKKVIFRVNNIKTLQCQLGKQEIKFNQPYLSSRCGSDRRRSSCSRLLKYIPNKLHNTIFSKLQLQKFQSRIREEEWQTTESKTTKLHYGNKLKFTCKSAIKRTSTKPTCIIPQKRYQIITLKRLKNIYIYIQTQALKKTDTSIQKRKP